MIGAIMSISSGGKIEIFTELKDSKYNVEQEEIKEVYSNDNQAKFLRCFFKVKVIVTEAVKLTSLYPVSKLLELNNNCN